MALDTSDTLDIIDNLASVRSRRSVPVLHWLLEGVLPECPTVEALRCPRIPDPVPDVPGAVPASRARQFIGWWNGYREYYGMKPRLWRGRLEGSPLHVRIMEGLETMATKRIAPPHWIAFLHGMDGVARWSIETACAPSAILKYRHFCRDHYLSTGVSRVSVGPIATDLIHRYRVMLMRVAALPSPTAAQVRACFDAAFPGDDYTSSFEVALAESDREARRIRGALACPTGIWIWPFDQLGRRTKDKTKETP